MLEFTIDRKTWARGGRSKSGMHSCLLNNEGNMCCLGFYQNQIDGIDKENMLNCSYPTDIYHKLWVKSKLLFLKSGKNKKLTKDAALINDSTMYEERRESKLTSLFKKNGVKVNFIN